MGAYFDNAATTQVCSRSAQAALYAMTECFGNPGSTHTMGRQAAKLLKDSRQTLADALKAQPGEIFFTSGGTESDNWAILCGAKLMSRTGKHIISSKAEHPAVLRPLEQLESQGWEITLLDPEKDGSISPQAVAEALREDTALVSLMLVNNETGGITDISAVSRLIKESGSKTLLHCDAVQGFLKVPFNARELGADLISISGHKIHGPKGVGALYVNNNSSRNLRPLIYGGGQEDGKRSGTEPMPLIAAFAAAVEEGSNGLRENYEYMRGLKERLTEDLLRRIPDMRVLSGDAPHILSLSFPGYKSEVLMNFLEAREIYVSKSSACKKGGRSHVLQACGHSPELIDGAIRVGLSRYTTAEEITALADGLESACASLAKNRR